MTEPALTHVDAHGAARMVDVSDKVATVRSAIATGVLHTTARGDRPVAARRTAQG